MRSSILGVDCPATGTSSHFRATQAPSHRIASCLAPPSVSSTTSTATRHHQARQNISSPAPSRPPPRHWSYPAVPSSKPIPDRRLLLGVRVRSCLAWSDAGSGQSTVDSRQGSLSQTKNQTKKKSARSSSQKSEPLPRCLLSTRHPPPSTGTDRCCPSHRQIRAAPPSPSPVPVPVPVLRIAACLSSSQAAVACRRQSPVARHSPVSLASHTLLHAPATPSPPPRLSAPERVN